MQQGLLEISIFNVLFAPINLFTIIVQDPIIWGEIFIEDCIFFFFTSHEMDILTQLLEPQ